MRHFYWYILNQEGQYSLRFRDTTEVVSGWPHKVPATSLPLMKFLMDEIGNTRGKRVRYYLTEVIIILNRI